jgi:hypothetical protein
MKYRIFIVKHPTYYTIDLHNLEKEADGHTLCNVKLKTNIEPYEERIEVAKKFAEQVRIVLGLDNCDIIETSAID